MHTIKFNAKRTLTHTEIAEYNALRNEIITYINLKQNLVYLSLLVITALIGLQITTKLCYFSLCSVITIYAFFILDLKYKTGIALCGAYIRAKFENESNELNWETIVSKINEKYDFQKKHKAVIKVTKYTSRYRSIFDYSVINHFTVFSMVSLFLGWISLLDHFLKSSIKISEFTESEIFNIFVMGLTTIISIMLFIHVLFLQKRDFNRIRKEFYVQIRKLLLR